MAEVERKLRSNAPRAAHMSKAELLQMLQDVAAARIHQPSMVVEVCLHAEEESWALRTDKLFSMEQN